MAKTKYYVVINGYNPGIYETWEECKSQIDGFSGAVYKSFKSLQLAKQAFEEKNLNIEEIFKQEQEEKNKNVKYENIKYNSICVDGACSGNPGLGEYQVVDTKTKEVIIAQRDFYQTTNNIMEFFALVQALKYVIENNLTNIYIYTDSVTALSWVKNKKVKTKLEQTKENWDTFKLITEYENWLKQDLHDINIILKWDTKKLGEIPADFGRK